MKSRDKTKDKSSFNNRVKFIYAICFIMALVFVLRLFFLQVIGGENYKQIAEEQRKSKIEIPPERGEIYDSNMTPLALSINVNALYLFPAEIKDKTGVSMFLAEILNERYEDILKKIELNESFKLSSKLSNDQTAKIKNRKLAGVKIVNEKSRYYPEGDLASYIIGFLDHEGHGEYGIESSFDKELYGESGLRTVSISPSGDIIPYDKQEEKKADQGDSVVLTVDERIQELLGRYSREVYAKYKPNKMTIIVLNPNNGDVLGLDNYPKYNSNNPRQPRTVEEREKWESYSEEELLDAYYAMWRSFAINDIYEPGSVFKFITAAAAVEEGTATDSSVYHCDGVVKDIPGIELKCWRWDDPHGDQNLVEAMDNSCNPAFIQIARDLGKEKMYKYINDFGFGVETGIRLPAEAKGIIHESIDSITPAYLATMSYGHGIAVTPIQMVTAISAVVNGGNLYTPRIVKEIIDDRTGDKTVIETELKRRVISEETSQKMREMMEHGVEHGTADGARIPGYKIGGKTGTSVKFVDGKYELETTVASYLGVFPADKPEYIILAVVDEPHGASSGNIVSAPLVKNIIEGIIDLKGYKPTEKVDIAVGEDVEVPNVIGLPLSLASKTLKELGFQYSVLNPNMNKESIISNQAPMAGEKLSYGSVIDIMSDESGNQPIQMPNLVGMESDEATEILKKLGLHHHLIGGEGIVESQIPIAGEMVGQDSLIEIRTSPSTDEDQPEA
ncbi:MAG: penicillin-binding transpeptidase domain-containing protein [Tissierellia bacterium]|nr:penicillin-binding transpeptidase domain-containing protein [Tissierellia bacterium]